MEEIPEGYIRVSSILQIFQAYAFVPKEKLKKAQEVGIDIHEAIKSFFDGSFQPLELKKAPYMESFLRWVNGRDIDPILSEKRLYDHSLRLTGQIDLLAKIDGQLHLIDFKTGSWAHPEIWRLQATFYRMLLQAAEMPVPEKFLFIQLLRDGTDPILFPFTYRPEDQDACLHAYRMYWYFHNFVAENPTQELSS